MYYNYLLLVNIVASTHDVRPTRYYVVFNAGVNTRTFKIAITDDEYIEGTETFGAQLVIPDHHKSKCLKLGDISVATVYINDGMFEAQEYMHSYICYSNGIHVLSHFVVLKQMIKHQLPAPLLNHLQHVLQQDQQHDQQHDQQQGLQQQNLKQSLVRYILSFYHLLIINSIMLATEKMSVKVQFEFGRYKVQESCTMLPVTLVVKGEVLKPFTVGVSPIAFYIPSAQGMQ